MDLIFDIEGNDMVYKFVILISLVFGIEIVSDFIYLEGIILIMMVDI